MALLEAEISLYPEIEEGLEDETDIPVKSLTTNVEKSDENNNVDFDLSTELGGEKECEKVLSADSQIEKALDLRIVRKSDDILLGSVVNDDKAVSVDLEFEHTYVVSSENNSEVACHSKDKIHVDRKPRSNERTRHSLKRSRSSRSSRSSSSNGSFSEDSSDDSDDEMENKFCNIMCDLVKKTGSIIGEQIIKNAELINKLQNTVDDLRKEVAELRKEKSERNETINRRSDSGVIRGESE